MALCDILSSGIFQIFICLAILAYFTQSCLAKQTKAKRQNLQIKWNAVGKDVVILHQFPRARFCPSPSPYPIKLETFLRMHNIKYINDFEEPMSEKEKSPWITINGTNIADSQIAIEYLTKKFSLDINKNLTSNELVISRAIRFLIEQDLYWAFAYDRWVKSRAKYVPQFFAPVFPSLPRKIEAWLITTIYSTKIAKQVYAQGMGRHSCEDVESMGLKDLDSLSEFLGEKEFMFGKKPTELDAVLFGFMCMLLYCTPKNNRYVQKLLREHTNLVRFTEKMKHLYWSDWDQCLYNE